MRESKNDRLVALLFFKDQGAWTTFITGFIGAIVITPFNFFFSGYPPEEFGTVLCMHVMLAIVSVCILKPFGWARLFVFEKSATLQRRYAHYVIEDAMERKLEESHSFFLDVSHSI